jgi:iron complex outermembrane receptor protein
MPVYNQRLLIAALCSSMLVPMTARAQDEDASHNEPDSGEIIVTAQKRSERLLDVPIAISAISADALSSKGAVDLTSLQGMVPSLSITGFGGSAASNLISIRGITGQPLPIGASQATSVYIDGVYLSRPDAGFFALDDLERIEVLRGPQGTLYGRNATAGAVNIITRQPGNTARASIDLSYGNFNAVQAKGALSGPLAGGLSASISGLYQKRDGYFLNTVSGHPFDGRKSHTVRGQLRYQSPDKAFSATLSADTARVDAAESFRNQFNGTTFLGASQPDVVSFDNDSLIQLRSRSDGVALTMNLDASDAIKLTSVSSYRSFYSYISYDGDGSAAPTFLVANEFSSKAFSQELRALFDFGRLRITVGGNYYRDDQDYGISVASPSLAPTLNNPRDASLLNAVAFFSQVEYDLTERLKVNVGLRFNKEDRDFTVDYSNVGGLRQSGKVSDNAWIPSFGLSYKATPDILFYAKVSKGYQAPGFNTAQGRTAPLNIFSAENLLAYEAGVKGQILDRRIMLELAGFYYDYMDLQIRSVTGPGLARVDNAAAAKVQGVEGTLSVRVAPGLTFGGQASYIDTKYKDFCQPISGGALQAGDPLCPNGSADRAGNRLTQAPEWSGSVFVDFNKPISELGNLRARASYSWESNVFFTTSNEPLAVSGGWHKLDARVGIETVHGVEVYAFGNNLTNERHVDNSLRLLANLLVGSINPPRTYGIGLRWSY